MLIASLLPLACMVAPLAVGVLSLAVVRLLKERHSILVVAGSGLALALAIAMMKDVLNGASFITPQISMKVDLTNWIMVLGIALIYFLSAIYNIGSDRGGRLSPSLYDFFLLFLMSIMLGLVMFEDLFWIYLLVETTVGVSIVLVAYAPGKFAIQAAFKYLVITAISAIFFLAGVLIVYWLCGTTHIPTIAKASGPILAYPHLLLLSVGFFIVGLGADLGIPPFHGWLPDAFPASTPAVNSFMCAESVCLMFTLHKVVYPFYSIYPSRSVIVVFFGIGIFSAMLGAFLAYGQENFWRLAAYITIDGYGHAALAFGLFTAAGFVAGQFYLINASLMKMGILQSLGSVFLKTGSAKVGELGGLGKVMKKTASGYLACAVSLGGIPPLSGFYGKLLVYSAVLESLSVSLNISIAFLIMILLVVVSVISLAALMRTFQRIFLRKPSIFNVTQETPMTMWLPAMLAAALGISIGIFPQLLLNLIKPYSFP